MEDGELRSELVLRQAMQDALLTLHGDAPVQSSRTAEISEEKMKELEDGRVDVISIIVGTGFTWSLKRNGKSVYGKAVQDLALLRWFLSSIVKPGILLSVYSTSGEKGQRTYRGRVEQLDVGDESRRIRFKYFDDPAVHTLFANSTVDILDDTGESDFSLQTLSTYLEEGHRIEDKDFPLCSEHALNEYLQDEQDGVYSINTIEEEAPSGFIPLRVTYKWEDQVQSMLCYRVRASGVYPRWMKYDGHITTCEQPWEANDVDRLRQDDRKQIFTNESELRVSYKYLRKRVYFAGEKEQGFAVRKFSRKFSETSSKGELPTSSCSFTGWRLTCHSQSADLRSGLCSHRIPSRTNFSSRCRQRWRVVCEWLHR
mmetsp:Transcript_9641/g.32274  ORF Transcript_9641/g.32274 Transcript_9641/m.32274 type:complete len:370 (-) Transcript_9641:223-1332(-)